MDRTALLTIGRFPKALTLARSLHRYGVRVLVADPLKRQLCSVSRSVSKNYRVTAPNTDIRAWETDILDIIDEEQVTDLIPVSEEVCHVANLAPKLPEHVRYVGPSTTWITRCAPPPTLRGLMPRSAFGCEKNKKATMRV